jgi:uncharacterized membrane protein YhfC
MHVSILILTYAVNAVLMIAMPVGLAIFLARRWRLGWRVWWIGFLTFVLSQIGHIPFNAGAGIVLNRTGMVYWSPMAQHVFNAVFLGLSAGLFEEGARYLVLRFWARDARSWRKAVQFGAGHGGAEAIIVGGLALANYIAWLVLRNPDSFSTYVTSKGLSAAQIQVAQQQMTVIWSAPWYQSLLGALERFFAIPVQICLAVLVMQAFTRKQPVWFWLAVLFHALVDGVMVFLSPSLSVYALEGVVGLFAIAAVILIFRLRQTEPAPEPGTSLTLVPVVAIRPVEETPENLDGTKFQG